MSNKIIRIILVLIVAGVIGLLAYNKVKKDDKLAIERKAMTKGSGSLMADAYIVKPVPLKNDINATGTLLSNETIQVQPQITGRITHLYFKEGAYVQQGDLLVTLYDGDLQAQLEKARIQQSLADTTLARQKQLLAIHGISQQDVDNTQNQVASYEADLNYYKAQITETKILAPFSGRVGLRQVSEGAIVSPTTVITTLYQNDPLKLEFSIPEKYRSQIKIGDKVSFTVSEMPDRQFTGKVYAINPGIDPQTRTITMRAWVSNKNEILSPGAFANVYIELHEIPNALMIPTESLIPTTQDAQVVVCKDGKANFVTVKTGIRTADKVQITSGIRAGDTVLTTGIMQVGQGVPLHIMHLENK
jgi:membrane fusion protein (multidrug efflux system)